MNSSYNQKGLVWGFVSYALWGFFPVYWKLLQHVPALEILAHRMAWSFVFYLGIFLFVSHRDLRVFLSLGKRDWMLSSLASLLLAFNWGIYIYAVNTGHILEGSLAYFINPILNVAVGVLFFKEEFPLILRLSVGAAAIGVGIKILFSFGLPWM